MENDAEGTVVGVGFKRVGVCYLDDCDESKQDKAEDRRHHRGTGLDEEAFASSWLELVQRDLQVKDTQIWTQERRVRLRRALPRAGARDPWRDEELGRNGKRDKGEWWSSKM